MDIRRQAELKEIVSDHLEITPRVTRPTAAGVKAIAKFLGCETFEDYLGVHAADILLSIDAADGTRAAINNKAAKSVLK